MKSLFNISDNKEIVDRINSLFSESKREWGTMNVSQMLAHVQTPLKIACGELRLNRSLAGFVFGRIAKRKLSGEKQWRRNMPTDKNFVIKDKRNFEEEKAKLLALVHRFGQSGPGGILNKMHPFFGNLTADEWDKLMWNHLDHHLRQFGA